ncbi:MAG: hypothetical protein E6Q96_06550 [Cyclobacteriaceae bacterium]|nr:MAG: hypothetical protein E6Q96_06550 [Cyclobacteriaceae bacterium]
MKRTYIVLLAIAFAGTATAQEFQKNISSARTAYAAGNLQDARFAMEQMLRDLDVEIGKEILKLLPAKVGTRNANAASDNVTGTGGLTGLFVERQYGTDPNNASIEIINNSPLITSLGVILAAPMMHDQNQKVIKVQGYKALLTKNQNSETGKTGYELQIPMNNTLITLKITETTETEITAAANTIPLSKIAEKAG